jgi:hypothetical protein
VISKNKIFTGTTHPNGSGGENYREISYIFLSQLISYIYHFSYSEFQRVHGEVLKKIRMLGPSAFARDVYSEFYMMVHHSVPQCSWSLPQGSWSLPQGSWSLPRAAGAFW